MKKIDISIFAILFVIFLEFSFIACESGGDIRGDEGTFTLTNIPAKYNGKYAYFNAIEYYDHKPVWINGIQDWGFYDDISRAVLTQISDGKAVIPLYLRSNWIPHDLEPYRYKGNHTYRWVNVFIHERPMVMYDVEVFDGIESRDYPLIKFSNGSATLSWNVGEEWSSSILPELASTWYYNDKELFSIGADGTGSIEGQGSYSVQERYNPREVRFIQRSNETGQFTFWIRIGEDSAMWTMWIRSGTGPFRQWANYGDYSYVIIKK